MFESVILKALIVLSNFMVNIFSYCGTLNLNICISSRYMYRHTHTIHVHTHAKHTYMLHTLIYTNRDILSNALTQIPLDRPDGRSWFGTLNIVAPFLNEERQKISTIQGKQLFIVCL